MRTTATVICVGGVSGSGKSTLTDNLAERLGREKCLILRVDNYYKESDEEDINERAKVNYDDPKESSDLTLLYKHLVDLKRGLTIQSPEWDFTTHSRKPGLREINPQKIEYIIVEGIFALNPLLRRVCDVGVYVDTDVGLALVRRIDRDMAERGRTLQSILKQYKEQVQPMQVKHVIPTRDFADVLAKDSDDIALLLQFIADLDKDELEIIAESLSAAKTSVTGIFSGWMSYATEKFAAAGNVLESYIEDETKETTFPPAPPPSPTGLGSNGKR